MKDEASIAVFDSGVGGLTVLKEIRSLLPSENLIYFGDTAHVPYGTKSKKTVLRYSKDICDFLISQNVKAIVVACNTASAYALDDLKQIYDLPLIGVIEAGAKKASRLSKNKKIGLIGTEGTVKSASYLKALKSYDSQLEVYSRACPLLVTLAEEGRFEGDLVQLTLQTYLNEINQKKPDTLILACTHYPLFKKELQKYFKNRVQLVDSAIETAYHLKLTLEDEDLLRSRSNTKSKLRIFSSDDPERLFQIGEWFLGAPLDKVTQVSLES